MMVKRKDKKRSKKSTSFSGYKVKEAKKYKENCLKQKENFEWNIIKSVLIADKIIFGKRRVEGVYLFIIHKNWKKK